MRRLLREPLIHFLALGAALFLFFQWRGGGSGPGSGRIALRAAGAAVAAAGVFFLWRALA